MYISEDQVEQVRKSCDIVAIAGQITRLRKKKNSLWGGARSVMTRENTLP